MVENYLNIPALLNEYLEDAAGHLEAVETFLHEPGKMRIGHIPQQ